MILDTGPPTDCRICWSGCSHGMFEPAASAAAGANTELTTANTVAILARARAITDIMSCLPRNCARSPAQLRKPRRNSGLRPPRARSTAVQATVNYLWSGGSPNGQYRFRVTEEAAQSLRVDLRSRVIGDISEIDDALAEMKAGGAVTVIVQSSAFTFRHRGLLIDSAMNHRVALIYGFPPAAREGALIAFGPDYGALYYRAASYVKRMLQGAMRSDLPVDSSW